MTSERLADEQTTFRTSFCRSLRDVLFNSVCRMILEWTIGVANNIEMKGRSESPELGLLADNDIQSTYMFLFP